MLRVPWIGPEKNQEPCISVGGFRVWCLGGSGLGCRGLGFGGLGVASSKSATHVGLPTVYGYSGLFAWRALLQSSTPLTHPKQKQSTC